MIGGGAEKSNGFNVVNTSLILLTSIGNVVVIQQKLPVYNTVI